MSNTHTFEHKAMKTTFKLRLLHDDKKHAQNAAYQAIDLIDEVEAKLSRYRAGSDVWQINHMEADQTLFISELCYECLCLSLKAYTETMGLFDVTLGRQIEHRKQKDTGEVPELCGQLVVSPDRPAVYCNEPGREIDLGGIGKGYALDKVKERLEEWGIESGIVSAGASTHLAFGDQEWKMGLSAKNETRDVVIKAQALSASGTGIQEAHIIDPGGSTEACQHPRIWTIHESAAWADVWSTAAMLIPEEELQEIRNKLIELFAESPQDGRVIAVKAENA